MRILIRALSVSRLQALTLVCLAALTMLCVSLVSYRWVYSAFYRLDIGKMQQEALVRRDQAVQALKDIRRYRAGKGLSGPMFANPSAHELCIGIVTMARKTGADQLYLSQTIAGLLTRTSWVREQSLRVTVFNIDGQPEKHVEAKDLSDLITVRTVDYGELGLSLAELKKHKVLYKETADYLLAMKGVFAQECRHYLMIEDDAVAARKWYDTLMRAIDEANQRWGPSGWLYLKLFTTLRYSGFYWVRISDWLFILGGGLGFALLIFGVGALALFSLDLCRNYWKPDAPNPESKNQADEEGEGSGNGEKAVRLDRFRWCKEWLQTSMSILLVLWFLGSMVIVLPGRQNWLYRWRRIIDFKQIRFGLVAQLYSPAHVQAFWEHLRSNLGPNMMPKDEHHGSFLQKHHDRTGEELATLIHVPDLFQHIGIHSSLWSAAYDAQNMQISHSYRDEHTPLSFDQRIAEEL